MGMGIGIGSGGSGLGWQEQKRRGRALDVERRNVSYVLDSMIGVGSHTGCSLVPLGKSVGAQLFKNRD